MSARKELLTRLVSFERPHEPTLKRLSEFGWDSDEELLEVLPSDIVNALHSYIDQKVTSTEVEEWANALECREDLKTGKQVREAIHTLANPLLTKSLSSLLALQLIKRLGNEQAS